MEKRDLIAIRSDKKGNIIRTYKNIDFFQFHNDDYVINDSSTFYVYDGKRFEKLEELTSFIDNEINNNYKNKINAKIRSTQKP